MYSLRVTRISEVTVADKKVEAVFSIALISLPKAEEIVNNQYSSWTDFKKAVVKAILIGLGLWQQTMVPADPASRHKWLCLALQDC